MNPEKIYYGDGPPLRGDLSPLVAEFSVYLAIPGRHMESSTGFRLRCPNPSCGGESFLLNKTDGYGVCLDEQTPEGDFREYHPMEIADLLGIPVSSTDPGD